MSPSSHAYLKPSDPSTYIAAVHAECRELYSLADRMHREDDGLFVACVMCVKFNVVLSVFMLYVCIVRAASAVSFTSEEAATFSKGIADWVSLVCFCAHAVAVEPVLDCCCIVFVSGRTR